MAESTGPHRAAAGRPRLGDIEMRMETLLETADRLFLDRGYGETSLSAIAREAHVALRTIYRKFGGKAGLFRAVIERGRKRYDLIGNMMTDTRVIRDILEDFGLRLLRMMSTPEVLRMYRMVIAGAHTQPEIAIAFDRGGSGQILENLGHFFARPVIAACFRADVTPEHLALHLYNCILGNQTTRLIFEPPAPGCRTGLEDEVELAVTLFLKAMARDPARRAQT